MAIPRFIKPILKKWYYSYWPGQAGSFPYFGTRVHFPPHAHLFLRVCAEDIYESGNVRLLTSLLKPQTFYFDVGANIGLMSVPLLRDCPKASVVSFEPSPSALPYLLKTHEGSPFKERWRIVPKAVGKDIGSLDFYCCSTKDSAFDGLQDTGRSGNRSVISVPVTTLDTEWQSLGQPSVSVIKIDVEGGELGVLHGGGECISACLPAILIEWSRRNLQAYDCKPEALLDWANATGYVVHSLPYGVPATSGGQLKLQMLTTENFALLPVERK